MVDVWLVIVEVGVGGSFLVINDLSPRRLHGHVTCGWTRRHRVWGRVPGPGGKLQGVRQHSPIPPRRVPPSCDFYVIFLFNSTFII